MVVAQGGNEREASKPLFTVIGTYYDKTKGLKKLLNNFESLEEKNAQLIAVLHEFRDHLVFYNETSEELIFPVDNLCHWNRKKNHH